LCLTRLRHPLSTRFPYTTPFRSLLFGVQLGGGTDINGAVGYCQSIIREPRNTVFVLISDLYEGGVARLADDRLAVAHRTVDVRPDRKSTRLNSSHGSISYAVLFL